jgi:hypothetical protein
LGVLPFALQKSSAAFSLIAQAQRKSFKKETPKRNFALCGARGGLRTLHRAAF